MFKILVPVDGSQHALRALQYAISHKDWLREALEIHLLNVQLQIVSGAVKMFVAQEQLNQYYHDEGEKALAPARQLVEKAGVALHTHIGVGEPAPLIARYARDQDCRVIVMATRGMSAVANMLMGSVTTKTIHLAEVPVVLVK